MLNARLGIARGGRNDKIKIADEWLRQILALLYERRSLTRNEIIESTGLNSASVSHALRYLLSRGVLLGVGAQLHSCSGRRREVFSLNAEAGYFVALDLEPDRIRFALANFPGDLRCRWEDRLEFREPLTARKVVDGIGKILRDLDENELSRVLAAGVSYPGRLDSEGCLTASNLGWRKFPLVQVLNDAFPWPLFLEQDKHSCVLVESRLGAAQMHDNALFLIAEAGIGLGIMVQRKPLQGAWGFSGEIGHWKVFPEAEDLCNCGHKGCLEAIASGVNIVRQYLELSGTADEERRTALVAGDVFERARRQDPAALAVLERAGRALGTALSQAIALLNPEIVIIGGDFIGGEDVLLPIMEREIRRQTRPGSLDGLKIVVSALGLDIRLKGAASMAFRRMLDDSALLQRMCQPVLPGADAHSERTAFRAFSKELANSQWQKRQP